MHRVGADGAAEQGEGPERGGASNRKEFYNKAPSERILQELQDSAYSILPSEAAARPRAAKSACASGGGATLTHHQC